jgi:outer membrane protein
MSRLFKLFLSLTIVALSGMHGWSQTAKFGYVNSAAILSEMPEVKQADANLEALQKQLQKKGQSMVEKLQQDYTAIQQKMERGELSRVQQEDEARKLEQRQTEIANFEQDMMRQMQDKRNELLEPIYAKVNNAISAVAKENGYKMIFDATVLLYKDENLDVSAMVKSKLGL